MSSFQAKNPTRKISSDFSVYNIVPVFPDEKGVFNRKKQRKEVELKPNINFSDLKLNNCNTSQRDSNKGFDFGAQYKCLLKDNDLKDESEVDGNHFILNESLVCNNETEKNEKRYSLPISCENTNNLSNSNYVSEFCNNCEGSGKNVPPIWCLDCLDNLIVVGCSNGRIEFWECITGRFKVIDKIIY